MKHGKWGGWTLIEVMIVVAIIGILSAIAYPSYSQYIVKANRVQAQSHLLEIVSALKREQAINPARLSEQPMSLSSLGYTSKTPDQNKPLYQLSLEGNQSQWLLIATPEVGSVQYGNGHLVINQSGERCWQIKSDLGAGACVPSALSNWDGK